MEGLKEEDVLCRGGEGGQAHRLGGGGEGREGRPIGWVGVGSCDLKKLLSYWSSDDGERDGREKEGGRWEEGRGGREEGERRERGGREEGERGRWGMRWKSGEKKGQRAGENWIGVWKRGAQV